MLPSSLYLGEPGLCLSCASSPKGAASQPEKDCVKLVRPSDSVWPTDAAASFRSLKASPDACHGHACAPQQVNAQGAPCSWSSSRGKSM